MIWFDVIRYDPTCTESVDYKFDSQLFSHIFTSVLYLQFERIVNRLFMHCRCCDCRGKYLCFASFQFCWFLWWKRLTAFFRWTFHINTLICVDLFVLLCFFFVWFCQTHTKMNSNLMDWYCRSIVAIVGVNGFIIIKRVIWKKNTITATKNIGNHLLVWLKRQTNEQYDKKK